MNSWRFDAIADVLSECRRHQSGTATEYIRGPIPPFGERIDNRPFELHGYVAELGEVSQMMPSSEAT